MIGHSLFIACLSLNVYHEARGEPEVGQKAVALVTMNRFKQAEHKDMCKTVFEKDQFSWTQWGVRKGVLTKRGKPSDKKAWEQAKKIAVWASVAKDFTRGATHFHELSVRPYWSKKFILLAEYGRHKFYKEA